VHCGLCLQNCPTYLLTGYEAESPRGRIHLIQALNEGRVEANAAYRQHIELCLVCRNCESVCPSGVHFGRIMEAGRAQLYADDAGDAGEGDASSPRDSRDRRARLTWGERLFRRVVFKELLPRPGRLRALFGALLVYQRCGLRRLVRATRILPRPLRQAESLLPDLPAPFLPRREVYPAVEVRPKRPNFVRQTAPGNASEGAVEVLPAALPGAVRYRVGLFTGCVMPLVYGPVHAATLRVLRHNGCEVHIPRQQVCCGALNVHAGERTVAREMARRNLRAFLGRGLDAIVVNSAGCGATMKEYGELFGLPEASEFAGLTKDVSEFLASIELAPPWRTMRRTVTLQESCHLVHAQRIKDAPRALLAAIPRLELRDMAHPDLCCGSAGLYMLTQREMSTRILDDKMGDIAGTGASTIVTANPGCMMQLQRGVRRAGLVAEVKHVVELLDEAYGPPSNPQRGPLLGD
jgi:glycolate oxidase iron-sulfur subunit